MTSVGALLTVLACVAVAVLPRRFASLAYLAAVLYITQGQAVDILGFNCMAIRFVEVVAAIRVRVRREGQGSPSYRVHRWLVFALTVPVVAFLLREGTVSKYQLGVMLDGLLVYYAFSRLFRDGADVVFFLRGAALLLIPFAVFMTCEALTGRNLFAVMGGVPESPILRKGYYRCQGSFRHAITAGTLGATFLPIFLSLLPRQDCRFRALLGIAASIVIVLASHSSGPLMAMVIAISAWGCWFVRSRMHLVRRGLVAGLIALHFMMGRPVWFIFDRISGILGGDGWHRANLIDKFVRHYSDWWLIGMPMSDTARWAATVTRSGYVDMTNHYVSLGVNGGIIGLGAFVGLLVVSFKGVGQGLRALRASASPPARAGELLLWGLGAAITTHAVNLSSVTYWDQSYVIWYLHLALAASLSGSVLPTAKCSESGGETT